MQKLKSRAWSTEIGMYVVFVTIIETYEFNSDRNS